MFVPVTMYTVIALVNCLYFSSNFNSCCQRLCEGIGPDLRKDDSCDRTSINMNYLSMVKDQKELLYT